MTVDVCVVVDKMRAACRLDAERVCWWWSVVVDNKDFLDLHGGEKVDHQKKRKRKGTRSRSEMCTLSAVGDGRLALYSPFLR